ncbi:TPA: helix-turn-helix domain-containing protein, partial [Citrobacter freundii]|nr:helix-turn-helix domain-containing protein [Citrobacter freundii]
MKITLTPQQKLQLEQMHDIERDSRVCDRIKAVLLASEGWSQTMISQALRIHESTVARHLREGANKQVMSSQADSLIKI